MKYGIIAAGNGERLTNEGISLPKPLVPLCGCPMIERLIKIFQSNGASEICIIVNQHQPQTEKFLRNFIAQQNDICPIRLVVKSTESSMHSFYELSSFFLEEAFCLTTVDTIFQENDFKEFINAFKKSEVDGLMAVTEYVDDEKPLFITTDSERRITAFCDEKPETHFFVSGGIYALKPIALKTLQRCINEGKSRMRNFQRGLLEDGLVLKAVPFSKILDVDHASDIQKAEEFIKQ